MNSASANNLLGGIQPQVLPNVASSSIIYNPSVPVIGDSNIVRNLRAIKMKDQFYVNNAIDGQMKNNDGLSLGANNKFLRHSNYDRQIDPNYLRRQNPLNKLHTDPSDFYDGSQLAYFELPKRIPRASIVDPMSVGAINPLNAYQYKSRFLDNKTIAQPKSIIDEPTKPTKTKETNMKDIKTNGFDPTDDLNAINKQIENDRGSSIVSRNIYSSQKTPSDLSNDINDKYGNPILKPPTKIAPRSTGKFVGTF